MEAILRFLNLLLAALVVGSVFGILVSFDPVSLSATAYVEQHQRLVRGLNVLLPVLGGVVIVSSFWLAYLNRSAKSKQRVLMLAGIAFVLAGLLTRFGNQPINALIMTWEPSAPPSNWTEWRDKWWFYHKLRFFPHLLGYVF